MTTDDLISVPGYTVHRLLGKGGMAAVYLATQNSLDREVAIKVLLNPSDEQFNQRFVSEARIIATLNHPRVITVYDVAQLEDGRHYIAMEYLSGGDLARLKGQMLGPIYALELIRQIAEGLSVVHRKGIIHRDIKPANILFRDDGTVVLTDFGIAKDMTGDCDLTQAGMSVGSPSYSSPEQSHCQPLDQRTDIYSLGVILLELLLGHNPYRGANYTETVLSHAQMPVPELPAPLRQYQNLINRMLAKNPADRFASADELLTVLTDMVHGQANPSDLSITRQHFAPSRPAEPEHSTRKIWIAVLLAIMLAGVSGGIFYFTYETEAEKRVNYLLARAEQRLQEEKFTEPEFDNARYFFNEVLTLEPQNTEALEGLERIRQLQLTKLLKLGSERFEQQRLTRPLRDNAYFYYQQALLLDPENIVAKEGLERITVEYIALAQDSFAKHEYGNGLNFVNQGLEVDPGNATLLELKNRYRAQSNAIQRFFNRVFN